MRLHRWLRDDPHFRAAHNAWQRELQESARSRLLKLADDAVDAVAGAMRGGDARSALAVLKGLGLLSPPQPGPAEPDEVQRQNELDKRERQFDADMRAAQLEERQFDIELG